DRQERGKFNMRGVEVFAVHRLGLVHQLRKREVEQRFNLVHAPSAAFPWLGGGAGRVEGEGLGQDRGHERGTPEGLKVLKVFTDSISNSIRYVVAPPWPLQHCLRRCA